MRSSLPELQPKSNGLVQQLCGHSGAQLALVTHDTHTIVRKTSKSLSANGRLWQQAFKQRLLVAQGFAFPKVHAVGTDEAMRAYFDMDYVPARTLAELLITASPYDHAQVFSSIKDLISRFAQMVEGTVEPSKFHDKITAISDQAKALVLARDYLDAIAAIAHRLHALDWSEIPLSPGHGDLTLENILVSPERGVIFIDCDEAWVSSVWLDLAKLFQDLEGLWFLRAEPQPKLDTLERVDRLRGQFHSFAHDVDPRLPPRLTELAALHLFRALPYVRSSTDAGFVCASIVRILDEKKA